MNFKHVFLTCFMLQIACYSGAQSLVHTDYPLIYPAPYFTETPKEMRQYQEGSPFDDTLVLFYDRAGNLVKFVRSQPFYSRWSKDSCEIIDVLKFEQGTFGNNWVTDRIKMFVYESRTDTSDNSIQYLDTSSNYSPAIKYSYYPESEEQDRYEQGTYWIKNGMIETMWNYGDSSVFTYDVNDSVIIRTEKEFSSYNDYSKPFVTQVFFDKTTHFPLKQIKESDSTFYNANGAPSSYYFMGIESIEYKYTYDEKGNWTRLDTRLYNIFDGWVPQKSYIRKYVYYEEEEE